MKLRVVRRLYDWVMGWAETRWATPALAVHATTESFVFPIPVDPLLMALAMSEPRRALRFALVASVFSVAGGLLGYAIGYGAYEAIGARIIAGLGYETQFLALQENFGEYTFLAIFAAGFTPLPYKVFTIAAGTCAVPLGPFFMASVLSRSARFFLVAWLIRRFGPAVREKIERYFDLFAFAFLALLVGGFFLVKLGIDH
ncbi:MAG: YqaA family protein [Gemmatimonadota bacterium]|nr:YqaA family protein [Gemmatimonadota bacterium]MDP7031583.1 YqaA family protein [Gemmatimonadota bacterium]